ncbi:MAG TPA: FkbM family methyltransferase [Acidimicrobiales bacterium]|nr:FkbM family methyltransferase [Acidimicrobiales bacterium]
MVDRHAKVCFSQEGEDVILLRLLEHDPVGTYVDVGAHHPARFSNTRLLYDRGWSGLNIDALPGSMAAFRKARRRDVSVEAGVGREPGIASYWQFVEPALSTFDEAVAESRIADGHGLLQRVDLPVDTLSHLIAEHLPGRAVDLLTVDVEGRDLDVLESLDWERYRPRVVVVESELEICDFSSGPAALLTSQGYSLYAATGLSRVFVAH